MAAPKTNKAKSANPAGGMMGMVSKGLAVTATILATLFFAAMFDVGHMGLLSTLAGLGIVLVPLFALLAIAAMFLAPKSGADEAAIAHTLQIADLLEFQSKATSQILTLQGQIDSLSGQDNETLKARNKELQAELNAIHQAEREKVDGQIEALRQRNEELEAQIKAWALEAVGKTIRGEEPQPMKAA
ncbi:MAG: hypothetical protein Q8S27_22875 [Hoeflea sp.]|uniref:hypothetical protein n=1 Tax=Hoeflea sp. TaxID=1940281 RepID=UPI00272FDE8D|nr:hypothetical protein [Hoeflea sp.]MDP2120071.1 hypothetical protein [Hoeflea sp.]MDP3527429.1 hypothetical protein [Hoeflea sp.]MDZ7601884.1 hypothetical protein [Hoeflea sp.]